MNALQPFASGDIFITGSTLDESARFPTGQGKVLQFGADWQAKASFETGHTGLISALAIDLAGNLHALDPQARRITSLSPDGTPIACFGKLPERAYGSMIVLPHGDFLIGEHMVGQIPGFSGEGKVYRVAADGTVLATYDTETNGGMGGFLGVTHMALSADGATLYHTSETGADVYAHDLTANKRLGAVYTRQDPPPLVFGLAMLADGRLALACGGDLRLIDPSSGDASRVALPEGRGWAVPQVRSDGHLWVLDFFAGQVICINAASGAVHEQHPLGLAKCLTGIAEIPAANSRETYR
jgi:sugar lactone lactonase YvrE